MAVVTPPRPPERKPVDADALEALIEEARRRARRRRIGYAACTLAALAGAAIFFGLRSGGGHTVRSPQDEASAGPNARATPLQRASSGFIAIARVYRGESHILLVDPSGRSAPRDLGPGEVPSWSPDGRKLVFQYDMSRGGRGGMDLYLISPDGDHMRRLTHQPNLINSSPTWSTDGKRIAFSSGRRDGPGPGPGGPNQIRTLIVIDQDGSNPHTIVRLRGHISGGPAW